MGLGLMALVEAVKGMLTFFWGVLDGLAALLGDVWRSHTARFHWAQRSTKPSTPPAAPL